MSGAKRTHATAMKEVRVRKVLAVVSRDPSELCDLEEDLSTMGCAGLLHYPWRIRAEGVVEELVNKQVPPEFAKSLRGAPDEWTAEVWRRVYDLAQGSEGWATRKDFCLEGKFHTQSSSKNGYLIRECKDARERRVLAFLCPIFNPDKPLTVTLTLGSTIMLALQRKREVNWAVLLRDLVQRQVGAAKRGQPTFVSTFLFHLYHHRRVLTLEEEGLWGTHQDLIELDASDSEPDALEEEQELDVVNVSEEETPSGKRRRPATQGMEGTPASRTQAANRGTTGTPSRPATGVNPLDTIIHDLEGVRLQLDRYEFTLQQIEGLVGDPPRGGLVAAVVASVGVMMFAAKPIGYFVDAHPSIKILALSFLTMVGTLLVAEAFDVHVPKGYVYTAMLISLGVEALNIRARSKRQALNA